MQYIRMQHWPKITVGKDFTQKASKEVNTEQKEKRTGKKKEISEALTSTKAKRKKGIKTDIITATYIYHCFAGEDKPKGAIIQLTSSEKQSSYVYIS